MQRHMPAGAIRFSRPSGGLYLWCRLAPGMSATALHDRALAAGVTFVAGPKFYPDPAGDSELRLCFTSILPTSMDEAVTRLGRCILKESLILNRESRIPNPASRIPIRDPRFAIDDSGLADKDQG
jgi:DNA-binding transcriptional MocR family regulator